MNYLWLWITVAFLFGFCLDWTWVQCVACIPLGRPLRAANLSVMLYVLNLVPTWFLMEHNLPGVAAYAAGGWLGTYLSARPKRGQKSVSASG